MDHSASSSPVRKKARLSSPTYDAYFSDLDPDDVQALDDIEAKLSQGEIGTISSVKGFSSLARIECPLVVDGLEGHNDSGILLVDREDVRSIGMGPQTLNSLPPKAGLTSPRLRHITKDSNADGSTTNLGSNFKSTSLSASAAGADTNSHIPTQPYVEEQSEKDAWFASSDASFPVGFASASAIKLDPMTSGTALTFAFNRASGKKWALPSTAALEAARTKLQLWETEIENELSKSDQDPEISKENQHDPNRVPLKIVENTITPPSLAISSRANHVSTGPPPRPDPSKPFRAPTSTTSLRNTIAIPSNVSQTFISNPVLARSSAAASLATQKSPLKPYLRSTPSTPLRVSSSSQPDINFLNRASQSKIATPGPPSQQKTKPLGLTPRAHAFTGSKTRPKFVTPFKQGMSPKDQNRDTPLCTPQPQPQTSSQHNIGSKSTETPQMCRIINGGKTSKRIFDITSNRTSLTNCGHTPQSFTDDELSQLGFDVKLLSLTSVSHLLYYRFNPVGADVPTDPVITQVSFGADTALNALLSTGCPLATKKWVDNHWSLILWKLIGMSCLDPTTLSRKWSWEEVMKQLRYRYNRELMNGARPALRCITTHDAPASAPLVLCVSGVSWTKEYVDPDGRVVPAHPELELTDGWYLLRASVDEALARAARNRILRVGRKIACSGARLEAAKKDPMEVLDAYGSMHLVLSGNSTHLAEWHVKLGFQPTPFVATLGSLSSDGGRVPLMDLLVTRVHPVGYFEYFTTETGEKVREGPRNETDEAREEDKWEERRAYEATKLREELEKKLSRLESYADRLECIAGSAFQLTGDESPPDGIDDMVEELEGGEEAATYIKRINPKEAGWLSRSLRKKCETDREKGGDWIDRELSISIPPRKVQSFRVLRVQDARTVRKAPTRVAQLTVWDVMSFSMTESGSAGFFSVGQRYMVTSLIPCQPSAWMGLEPGAEVFLSTTSNSKWKMIR